MCCDSVDVFLFADDTNLSGLTPKSIAKDLKSVKSWLNANKLVLDVNKTICMNLGNSASKNVPVYLNNCIAQCEPVCKYLGKMLESKLSFVSHVDYVMKMLGTQGGIISKLRHFVPNKELKLYYNSNVKSIIQYEVFVFGCCCSSAILRILQIQKKIVKLIHFRKERDHSFDLLEKHKVLNVFELHVYELLKFVLRSINGQHCEQNLNSFVRTWSE